MSRPVLVQRLLLPSNGSANANTQHGGSAMPALTNDANTTMPSSMLTANSKEEVPWTLADSCDTQTTTAVEITNTTVTATTTTTTTISTTTTTTATATNHNSQQQIACNNPTFLDTLQLAEYEELPQSSSSSQYQQQFENFEQLNDGSKAVALTTGIPSVDSAFDETSSQSCFNFFVLRILFNCCCFFFCSMFFRHELFKWLNSHASAERNFFQCQMAGGKH